MSAVEPPSIALPPHSAIAGTRNSLRGGVTWLLILPTTALYILLLITPLAVLIVESLRPYVGGRIGGLSTGWTLANYTAFFHIQYAVYFRTTIVLSLTAAVIGIALSYPVAHLIARTPSRRTRRLWINLLVSGLFLDTLIRCYAVALFFGPTGVVLPLLSQFFDILGNNSFLVRGQVVFGLLYFVIPVSTLTLVGAIENINPKLREAAQTLGASYWKSVLVTDVALSVPAMVSAFLISFTSSITAFIVPLILGKGLVIFVTNLIYERFSETANYPSGAALSVLVLVFSLLIVYLLTHTARRIWKIA